MKKWIALALAVWMALAMAACGNAEPPKSELTPNNNAATQPTGSTIEPVETTAPTEATEPSQEKDMVSLGQMQGGVYTNTYAGFQCTLNENWTYMTAEQLQELPGAAAELFEGTALDAEAISVTMIADMMAESATDFANINVQYQKLTLAQRLVYATATQEQVVDETLKEKDMLISTYTQAGMTDVTVEKKTVTFLGEDCPAIYTAATVAGVPCYILQIMDYSKGSFGVILTVTSYIEDTTESVLALFSKV